MKEYGLEPRELETAIDIKVWSFRSVKLLCMKTAWNRRSLRLLLINKLWSLRSLRLYE